MRLTVRICLLVMFVLLLLIRSASADDATVTETASWLEEKLTGLSATFSTTTRCQHSLGYFMSTRRIIGCAVGADTMTFSEEVSVASSDGEEDFKQQAPSKMTTVSFKDLYATASVKQMDMDPISNRLCTMTVKSLPYVLTINGRNGKSIYFWVPDEKLAERIGKAFEHLIKLSGS